MTVVLAGAWTMAVPAARAQTPNGCAGLTGFELPGVEVDVTVSAIVPAGPATPATTGPAVSAALPEHCRVEGVIERRSGVGGTPYGIGFEVALPNNWNGRFLFQGGGGLNGSVRPPLGAQAAGDRPALSRGFAVVSTDSGHEGAAFDGSFLADQEAGLNFLYRAVGRVTVVAKQIVAAYYGRPAQHSYFVGCSTGGREAMIMSQRYPTYFDGLVAGAPAMRTGHSNLGMRSVAVALNEVAQKDESGSVIPGSALSADDKALIVDAVLGTCDAGDGLSDGMIFNVLSCDFEPAELSCERAETTQCLSPERAQAVQTAFAGARRPSGQQIYPGYYYDTGITAGSAGVIPGLLNGAPSPVDPPTLPTEQDVEAEALEAATDASALGDTHAWTNLSTFSGNGGKLMFYHGVSDPWFSARDTVDYYERLAAASGGLAQTRQWSRLFLVPGMGHCSGGDAALDRFDMLEAMIDWVETGVAPDSVTATGAAFPRRSRPLCAYPEHAHYAGTGNPEDAASFECRGP
jgi:feruloyl esterase